MTTLSRIPAATAAADDPRLSPAAAKLYLYCLAHLRTTIHRPLCKAELALAWRMDTATIATAATALVDAGYLDHAPREGRPHLYRLRVERRVDDGDRQAA